MSRSPSQIVATLLRAAAPLVWLTMHGCSTAPDSLALRARLNNDRIVNVMRWKTHVALAVSDVEARGLGWVTVQGLDTDIWDREPGRIYCEYQVRVQLESVPGSASARRIRRQLSGLGTVGLRGETLTVTRRLEETLREPLLVHQRRENTHLRTPESPGYPLPLYDPRCHTRVIHNGG